MSLLPICLLLLQCGHEGVVTTQGAGIHLGTEGNRDSGWMATAVCHSPPLPRHRKDNPGRGKCPGGSHLLHGCHNEVTPKSHSIVDVTPLYLVLQTNRTIQRGLVTIQRDPKTSVMVRTRDATPLYPPATPAPQSQAFEQLVSCRWPFGEG